MFSCDQRETRSIDSSVNDAYVTTGFIINNPSDENGLAGTAMKCLSQQDFSSGFQVYAGHSSGFSDALPENYLSNHDDASFCVVEKVYDINGLFLSQKISFVLDDFIDEKYSYYFESHPTFSLIRYSFSTFVQIDFSNINIHSGMVCFALSLVNSSGVLINDFDASYGIDNNACAYFSKKENCIQFSGYK